MITLKINMVLTQDCYSLIVRCLKLKLKMHVKILVRIKKLAIIRNLAVIMLSQSIMMIQTNYFLVK